MTYMQILSALLKHYRCVYDVNVAVAQHRRANLNWNWVQAADDLYQTLEGGAK